MTEILLVVAVVVVLAIAFIVLSRRSGTPLSTESTREPELEEGVVSEPIPISRTMPSSAVTRGELGGAATTVARTVDRWTTQFEPRTGVLDDAARLKLINDLGMLRAAWCLPLLERASAEDTVPVNRAAAMAALARCREGGESEQSITSRTIT